MPANNDYPVLDGIAPSWADVIVRCSPVGAPLIEMKDIKAINTSRDVELGEQRAGGRVKKRTSGSGKADASMTLYKEGHQKLERALANVPGCPVRGNEYLIRFVHFGIQIQYTPPGSTEIYEKRLKGVCVIGDSENGAEGTDANTVEVKLSVVTNCNVVDGKEIVLI